MPNVIQHFHFKSTIKMKYNIKVYYISVLNRNNYTPLANNSKYVKDRLTNINLTLGRLH